MSSDRLEGWSQKPLESLCERVSVGYVGQTSSFFTGTQGVPFLRSQNVRPNKVDFSDIKFITQEFHKKNKKSQLKDGDLLIVRVGQNRGDCAVLSEGLGEINCANIVIARPDQRYSKYLGAYFNTAKGRESLLAISSGSAQLVLNTKEIAKIEVPVPPPNVAESIGCLSDNFVARINLLRATNQTLEAIAQALFKSWFVDFEPVRAKSEGKLPEGMDEATAALFPDSFKQSDSGEIPKGWESKLLGSLVVPKRGKMITRATIIDGNIPVVAGGIDPAYFHNQSNVSSPVVTISSSGNAGFVRLYQQDIWASDCSYISKEQSILVFYWYLLLKSNQEKIYLMRHGAVQQHVSPSDLMRLNVFFPNSLEIVSIFNEIVSQLFKKIELGEAQIKTLTSLQDSLLPRLISGRLRIADAEAEIEKVSV